MKEGPIFEKCVISLLDNSTGSYQVLETTECAPNNENRTEIYTNKRDFSHVGVDVIQTYADFEDTPDYPIDGVLSKVQVGLIKADATITLQKTGMFDAVEPAFNIRNENIQSLSLDSYGLWIFFLNL